MFQGLRPHTDMDLYIQIRHPDVRALLRYKGVADIRLGDPVHHQTYSLLPIPPIVLAVTGTNQRPEIRESVQIVYPVAGTGVVFPVDIHTQVVFLSVEGEDVPQYLIGQLSLCRTGPQN